MKSHLLEVSLLLLIPSVISQIIWTVSQDYLRCPSGQPCLISSSPCLSPKRSMFSTDCNYAANCPGLWKDIQNSKTERLPICYNPATFCYELLNKYSREWQCTDPRVKNCPLGLKLEGGILDCKDPSCPEDFVFIEYSKEYVCQKKTDSTLCPGDGQWTGFPGSYYCASKTCDLIQVEGGGYACPVIYQSICKDKYLTPSSSGPINGRGDVNWYCKNKKDDNDDAAAGNLPKIIVSLFIVVFFVLVYFYLHLQKKKGEKIQADLSGEQNQNQSYQTIIT